MIRRTLLLICLVLGLACSASADLVLHWTLDETSGAVAHDSSDNGNDGTVGGTANWVAGINRGALDFDASSTYIEQSNALVTGNCTIALWMMPRNLPYSTDYRSIMHGDVWEAGCIHGHLRANTSFINFEPNGGGAVTATTECVSDEWYHAVAAFDTGASEGRLYINGVLEHTSSGVSSSLYIGALNFGAWTGSQRYFDGLMDDIRIYDHAVTEEEVPVIMAGVAKELAYEPIPEDEAVDVIRDAALTWKPGEYAGTHNIYVGTSFEDVNTATVPTAAGLDVNSFAPDRFEFDLTYYWRVDEVNGTPDKTVFKGDVWSFTAEPYSIEIPGSEIVVTASSSSNEFSQPEKLLDGSGLGEDGSHAITPESMWFTASVDLDPWIQFEFPAVRQLDMMTIWNSNGAAESAIGWGVKGVIIEYSVDGENWTVLEGVNELARAPGLTTYAQPDEIAFNGVPAKMVRLDIESNWGGILMSYGLSEVKFNIIPAQARTPEPASGATGILPGDTVTWRAGREADTHTIYIGTDANAVAEGTAPSVTTNTNSLDLGTLGLELGETYYWRVDEVNDVEETPVWTGPVWDMTIVPAVVVDDFERYGNISPDRPFQTWLDGFGYSADDFFPVPYGGNGTGSGIGHDIWGLTSPHYNGDIMESTVVINGSSQSMPLYFDNSGGASQTDRNFAPAQDWTLGGATVLSIAVKGNADLAANSLYAKINGTKVDYDGDLTVPIWQAWHIDLAGLGDVSNVTSLSIGVEGTGTGMILLDDILLHKVAPVINQPTEGDKSLVAHWKFDETEGLSAADSSGYGNDGTLTNMDGTEWTTTAHDGGAIEFSGGQYILFGDDTSLQIYDSVTISAWVKMNEGNDGAYMGIGGKLKTAPYRGFSLVRHSSNVFRLWADDGQGVIGGFDASSDATYTDTEWHHVAGVVDAGTSMLYVDGVKQAKTSQVDLTNAEEPAHIGRQYSGLDDRYWNGIVDDVKIFYRALSEQEIQGL